MGYSRPEPLRGKHQLDDFESAAGSARVFVTTVDGNRVVGYYALTVGQVEPENASARLLKGQPGGRPVPVVILARLAVDQEHQSHGVGRSLLQDALLRGATAAESVGVRALVVHAHEEARDFYLRFGFEVSPTDPLHLILLVKDLKRFLDEVESS